MVAVFFLNKDIPPEKIDEIEKVLKKSPLVTKVNFISASQAIEKFREKFPELQGIIDNLKLNPFPPSFEVSLHEESLTSEDTSLLLQKIKNLDGIEDIQYNKDWVERMESLSRLAKAIGYFLGGILILASFFIISNVIKLNVFARKEEIQILRFVGATNTFIRIPFMCEGIILGITGGLLSLLLLSLIIEIFPIYLGSSLGVLNEFIRFRYLSLFQCAIMILSGAAMGFLGSLTSLAKFLKT